MVAESGDIIQCAMYDLYRLTHVKAAWYILAFHYVMAVKTNRCYCLEKHITVIFGLQSKSKDPAT